MRKAIKEREEVFAKVTQRKNQVVDRLNKYKVANRKVLEKLEKGNLTLFTALYDYGEWTYSDSRWHPESRFSVKFCMSLFENAFMKDYLLYGQGIKCCRLSSPSTSDWPWTDSESPWLRPAMIVREPKYVFKSLRQRRSGAQKRFSS